jgi:hypothetical protein
MGFNSAFKGLKIISGGAYIQTFPASVLSQVRDHEEGAEVIIAIPINKFFFFRKG